MEKKIQLIKKKSFENLIGKAKKSPRKRINHNFHKNLEDNPNRFLNVMIRETYIQPHRHKNPPKVETFIVLEGALAFFTLEDAEDIRSLETVTEAVPQTTGKVNIAANAWKDFQMMAPKFQRAKIGLWLYLTPPSEGVPDRVGAL